MEKITPMAITLRHSAHPEATESLIKLWGLQMYQMAIQDVLKNAQKFEVNGTILLAIESSFFRQMESGTTYTIEQKIK